MIDLCLNDSYEYVQEVINYFDDKEEISNRDDLIENIKKVPALITEVQAKLNELRETI